MIRPAKTLITSLALLGTASAVQAAPLPLIDIVPTETGVAITGAMLADNGGTYSGSLTIERTGAGGSATTRQSSSATLTPGEKAVIARSGISAHPQDHLVVTLEIRQDDRIVATAKTELNP